MKNVTEAKERKCFFPIYTGSKCLVGNSLAIYSNSTVNEKLTTQNKCYNYHTYVRYIIRQVLPTNLYKIIYISIIVLMVKCDLNYFPIHKFNSNKLNIQINIDFFSTGVTKNRFLSISNRNVTRYRIIFLIPNVCKEKEYGLKTNEAIIPAVLYIN